ncbi:signal peptidase II [Alloscardovia theropitheci]|uniref:signal peptidase II n=1 Tax=Alloscardovia theropitheci TaxID=2496842 RepID=UPI0013F16FB1|nr:signal peptidase II [Alloscardovia theropitheci]
MVNTSQRRSHLSVAVFISTALLGIALDQWSKIVALQNLDADSYVPIFGGLLHLTLVRNPGATLGAGGRFTPAVSIVAIIVSAIIAWAAVKTKSVLWALTLGVTLSGALGNIVDRVIYARTFLDGEVVDFINYGPFVGNVADVLLGVGVACFIIVSMMGVRSGIATVDRILFGNDAHTEAGSYSSAETGETAIPTQKVDTDLAESASSDIEIKTDTGSVKSASDDITTDIKQESHQSLPNHEEEPA